MLFFDFFERKNVMGLFSRKPSSNDFSKDSSNPWGSQNPDFDNTAVLLSDLGKRCIVCARVVLNKYLKKDRDGKNYCPDHEPK